MATKDGACLLSLKNIYRLLTKDDYPLHSQVPIGKSGRKGLTLTGFWSDILSGDMAVTPMGERLWSAKDDRVRYQSDLFNRTGSHAFYTDYFIAVSNTVSTETLLNIIQRLVRVLMAAEYEQSALSARLTMFIRLIQEHDVDVIPAIHTFFNEMLWLYPLFDGERDKRAFFDAYLLTFLALHAFFGMGMNNGAMARLRRNPAAQPQQLLEIYEARNRGAGFPPPEMLTSHLSALCRQPLEQGCFFGRKKELAALTDSIIRGGKLMISGMGGIGKTELLRQAMQTLLRNGIFTQIAYIQYEDNLKESFSRAFPDLHGDTLDIRFEECLEKLQRRPLGRTLLLIDNMNASASQDPSLESLSPLRCDVVMTSRLSGFMGFAVLPLERLEADSALKVFQSHFGRPLQEYELGDADRVLSDILGCHPLLCGLAGDMARAKHQDLKALRLSLENEGLKRTYVHEGEMVSIQSVLERMFTIIRLGKSDRRLLRLFALLPQRIYPFSSCHALFADITEDSSSLADSMERLAYHGWLQTYGTGFSMHPVIVETVLHSVNPHYSEYPKFWAFIRTKIDREKFRDWPLVDMASSALLRCNTEYREAIRLLLDTAVMQQERCRAETAEKLLDKAFAVTKALSPSNPSLLFDCFSVLLFCQQNSGRFDKAGKAVTDTLQLFPRAGDASEQANAIGFALYFASYLSMKDEARAALDILMGQEWEGTDFAATCFHIAMYNTLFTRNYLLGLDWAEKGITCLQEKNLLHTMPAGEMYKVLSHVHGYLGNPDKAAEWAEKALDVVQNWFGDFDSFESAQVTLSLGLAYYTQGQHEKALSILLEGYHLIRKNYGGDNYFIESALTSIGNVYHKLKDYPEAARYCREALEMHRRIAPGENLQAIILLNNLACVYRDSGALEDSLKMLIEAEDQARKLTGTDSVVFAEVSLNLGLLHKKTGNLHSAVQYLETAIPLLEKNYGKDHPKVGTAIKTQEECVGSLSIS